MAIYFSVVEALQNASKHAPAATEILVTVWEDAGELRFAVRDDGPGFNGHALPDDGGLVGIADRLGAFGGRLDIVSAPGAGTSVSGAIPARER